MNRNILFWIFLAFIAGCGAPPGFHHPSAVYPASVPEAPPPHPDTDRFLSTAYAYYGRGDYIRALRYAYTASEHDVSAPGSTFLLGLIYDLGLDRPDLALPEYRKILSPAPGKHLGRRLERRIAHLNRRACEQNAVHALHPGAPPPLEADDLAIFPLRGQGPKSPDPALLLGLTDILIDGATRLEGRVDPLRLHTVHHVFQTAHPEASPAEFAQWSGASRTLTGVLVLATEHRARITLRLLGPDGRILREAPPFSANLTAPETLYTRLLEHAAFCLDLSPPPDIPSPGIPPLALYMYAEGLRRYLSGQTEMAASRLSDARTLAPGSPLIARTRQWVQHDIEGARQADSLLASCKMFIDLPDPLEAARRRLLATHILLAPPWGTQTGAERIPPETQPRTGSAR